VLTGTFHHAAPQGGRTAATQRQPRARRTRRGERVEDAQRVGAVATPLVDDRAVRHHVVRPVAPVHPVAAGVVERAGRADPERRDEVCGLLGAR
jgi:hypothetical protein